MTTYSTGSGAMTPEALEIMKRFTVLAAGWRVEHGDPCVGNAMMAATICFVLSTQLPRDELATWLKKIADAITEETATPTGPLH